MNNFFAGLWGKRPKDHKVGSLEKMPSRTEEGLSIDRKVEKALDKATTEYRETFEKLAEYDKQE